LPALLSIPFSTATIRQLAHLTPTGSHRIRRRIAIGGLGPLVVVTPEQVLDALDEWVNETDVDSFNLAYAVTLESLRDFSGLVVPELQKREMVQERIPTEHCERSYFGMVPKLPDEHPGGINSETGI
jgi:long-chain alkane monooxygenase